MDSLSDIASEVLRHFLALAQNKGVIVVGLRENVFHYLLPDSQMFATWNDASRE